VQTENFSDLLIVIQELIHVAYQQSKPVELANKRNMPKRISQI